MSLKLSQICEENPSYLSSYAIGEQKNTTPKGGCTLCEDWIGVERNHTVLLLYVYVYILSTIILSVFMACRAGALFDDKNRSASRPNGLSHALPIDERNNANR